MYYGKEVRVFLKFQAKERYLILQQKTDKESKSVFNSVERIKNILNENPQHGEPVAKRLIPPKLAVLGIQNLYRVELSNYWRMLYTIEGNNVEILVFVLSITDHKDYNKLFGYK